MQADWIDMTTASENALPNEVGQNNERNKLPILKGAAFLTTVASAGMMAGFGSTLALAKKRNPEWFNKGVLVTPAAPETGVSLALRALGWGSLLSCCGVGMLSFTLWKILGVHNLTELRVKMASFFPQVPKKGESAAGSGCLEWDSVFKSK